MEQPGTLFSSIENTISQHLLAVRITRHPIMVSIAASTTASIELILRFGTGAHLSAGLATVANMFEDLA